MFIEVQDTPNPNTLKFLLNDNILEGSDTYHFKNIDEAKVSPLATLIFEIEGVKGIFLGSNFVSVIITDEANWDYVKPNVLSYMTDFLANGKDVLNANADSLASSSDIKGKDEEEQLIIDKIQELFEERIRPAVAMDGGDILFRDYDDGIVYLSLYGSCSGCPSSSVTLKNGIENMLKYYIPEVKEVISIE